MIKKQGDNLLTSPPTVMERHKKTYRILVNTKEVVTSIDILKSAFLWSPEMYPYHFFVEEMAGLHYTITSTADHSSTDTPEETSSTSIAVFPR
ncbi:hypothetical protein CDAR_85761 [Caerostris darwini]|uniref:Uncharacterized protein n=1 Tax=Caerostris darwini TaxID=1538125 RepID=A0AAV4MXH9_9ARAC|nr:hypothetical protein CDAR_85761 [Caerostris darwini]